MSWTQLETLTAAGTVRATSHISSMDVLMFNSSASEVSGKEMLKLRDVYQHKRVQKQL